MKINLKSEIEEQKTEKLIDPIILTLETQEDVDKMYAIFNHGSITDMLTDGKDITDSNVLYNNIFEFLQKNKSSKAADYYGTLIDNIS